MNDKYRIYLANILAPTVTWSVVYFELSASIENCSGRHCLGYAPLILLLTLTVGVGTLIFISRANKSVPKCWNGKNISYLCLIKKPIIIALCISVILIGALIYNTVENTSYLISSWFSVFVILIVPAILILLYMTVWYFAAGRHNKAFKCDAEKEPRPLT